MVLGVLLAGTSAGVSGIVAAQKGLVKPGAGKGPDDQPKEVPPDQAGRKGTEAVEERQAILNAVSEYREWILVNPDPYWVQGPRAAMCAAPARTKGNPTPSNPHQDKWIRVYVNPSGKSAMLKQKVPDFPPGTIIVKEKMAQKDSEKPELLTVMAKRAKGYNPDKGDWEYLAMDGDAKKVQSRGKLANCQACHVPQKESGYVFRDYLPDDVRKGLK